jgi:hypothetical protein
MDIKNEQITPKSNEEPKSSTLLSAFQGFLIFAILVIGAVLIYYILSRSETIEYPISPFNFKDTVTIVPAVLSQYGTEINPNQYLSATLCSSGDSCPDCLQNSNMYSDSCTLTFSGTSENQLSHWTLEQFWADGDPNSDANRSLESGYGNRFYLRSAPANPTDQKGRVRYSPFNSLADNPFPPSVTMPVIGDGNTNEDSRNFPYVQDWLVYFFPTNYPDLYYILFPGNITPVDLGQRALNNDQPNNGIVSIRPYADPTISGCYKPYDNNNNLYPNGPLLNAINPTFSPLGLISNPEVYLFKVTKV